MPFPLQALLLAAWLEVFAAVGREIPL